MAYVELLEKMDKVAMQKHLAVTTYKYIKVLLKSDRIKTQVGDTCSALGLVCAQPHLEVLLKSIHIKMRRGELLCCRPVLLAEV